MLGLYVLACREQALLGEGDETEACSPATYVLLAVLCSY